MTGAFELGETRTVTDKGKVTKLPFNVNLRPRDSKWPWGLICPRATNGSYHLNHPLIK